ncbi:predicted protein [Phaeodactylum tricornutum CCAP 1055/1]|uniref:Mitochondrial carrier protein n=2 Tax=Phaeodactylum tricornutum TaxID=2850 RepID=B7G0U6_PHATC|nr:predicted protein [Phaeodactylum tricornutum CCAP 1055/1]EEC47952.1 predicted protein [Phaeodactylum tricornutum CCAP 1055/1]|eukprot:XP_002180544.1 predicted protein [Phaeodactylum tricornutum CCAP 1055/1]
MNLSVSRILRGGAVRRIAIGQRGNADAGTQLTALSPTLLSVLAGSAAGAIGVGVAFPLDTLKTKAQTMRSLGNDVGTIATTTTATGTGEGTWSPQSEKLNMIQLIGVIWNREGLDGFFSGVKGMMIGQAIIKALAFSANANALSCLKASDWSQDLSTGSILLVAACFAGFVSSFVVAPIERIKVMMQSSSPGKYMNELYCLQVVLHNEGIAGLLTRGLGATLAREIPSYGIYFWLYGFLSQSPIASLLPATVAPLIFGAIAGMSSWLPVYPIDVVKTTLQNTEGGMQPNLTGEGANPTAWQVVCELYRDGGIGIFFDGLDAKMLRAAVNHAVTFSIYDWLMNTVFVANI